MPSSWASQSLLAKYSPFVTAPFHSTILRACLTAQHSTGAGNADKKETSLLTLTEVVKGRA